jgi:2-oxoglutarate ferredoxin oxidoreductase subunit gamma
MNGPSLDLFEDSVRAGGTIIVNSSLVHRKVRRSDVKVISLAASDEAAGAGFPRGANVILLTACLLDSQIIPIETLSTVIPLSLAKPEQNAPNQHMIEIGTRLYAGAE